MPATPLLIKDRNANKVQCDPHTPVLPSPKTALFIQFAANMPDIGQTLAVSQRAMQAASMAGVMPEQHTQRTADILQTAN